ACCSTRSTRKTSRDRCCAGSTTRKTPGPMRGVRWSRYASSTGCRATSRTSIASTSTPSPHPWTEMPIRYPVSQPVLLGNEKSYVLDAIETTWISSNGPYINRFERALDEYLGLEGCLVTNNGTTALHLACLAMGLGPGDEVIVPALTYVASANAVAYCGARPVFADCDPGTWNLTVDSVRRAWTDRTVGVIAVHLYGLPCPADEIAELCRQRGAW